MSKGRSLALVATAYVVAVAVACAWLWLAPGSGRLWLDTLVADLLATLVVFLFSRRFKNSLLMSIGPRSSDFWAQVGPARARRRTH